mmetsp:Transcript_46171/g.133011  ORF Transcript_46171/g.133011 Transcript_46171/m.133011 type:complete len:643 (-) Transcript_46171:318-2246(-)
MEFLVATKDGIIVMDATDVSPNPNGTGDWHTGKATSTGNTVKVIASLPSPPNAFGHTWSSDGDRLASVCDEGVRLYDANNEYKQVVELAKVAPDVGGRAGGVRNLLFSPKRNFLVTYEKWDPQYPDNVHLWCLEGEREGERLYSCSLKGYSSGALPVSMIRWTPDESVSFELQSGKGLVLRSGNFDQDGNDSSKLIAEKTVANFEVSAVTPNGQTFVSCFMPEGSMVARVAVYDIANPAKPVAETHLPAKVKDVKMMWNFNGTAVLVLANSDVDESGCSYFGTTYLYWVKSDGKAQSQIFGSKDGQVQDIAWSPTANEFVAIVGFQPANVTLHDGKNGKLISTLGQSRRNTLKWNPFGRFLAVGGFGTLAGDLDFFDRSKEETIASMRAPLTVECAFGPDGRLFLACTIAPRMNEGNQLSMYKYTGELVFKIDYVPEFVEARHEDTGAGARTKTQALLYAASWRPTSEERSKNFEDRPASPPRAGIKRVKGLPSAAAAAGPTTTTAAYRPRGAGNDAGGSVAAMMRGEMPAAAEGRGWGEAPPSMQPMEEWEIRKLEREAKKAAEKKKEEEKEAAIQARKDAEKAERGEKKKLKELKEQLQALEALKDKDWDELTEEDEEKLEGEVALRAEIAELEKKLPKD